MKLDLILHVTEYEIRKAAAYRTNANKKAKTPWKAEIDQLVKEVMPDAERKLRAQLAAALKNVSK